MHEKFSISMSTAFDLVNLYATCICALLFILTAYRFRSELNNLKNLLRVPILKYLFYRKLSRRFSLHWSRGDVLAGLVYMGFTAFCLCFKSAAVQSAAVPSISGRASQLALVNMIVLYAVPYLSSISSVLGLYWRTTRRIHGLLGLATGMLLSVHIISVFSSGTAISIETSEIKWAIIAASALAALLILSIPYFKGLYEIFLRLHQALAVFSIYGIWIHLSIQSKQSRVYLYCLVGVCGFSSFVLAMRLVLQNWSLSRGLPRAIITNSRGALIVKLELTRPVVIQAGQHIVLWVRLPSSLMSVFQAHPFTVVSWSHGPQSSLDLLVQPRSGLTGQLLVQSKLHLASCRALLFGPHGIGIPVHRYEVVVLIASGFGIAAQLPYLKCLLHSYNSRKALTRRIHLIWEVKDLDLPIAVQDLLNKALDEDTLDDGYILQISIYVEELQIEDTLKARAKVIKGLPDWYSIIRDEVDGKYIKRVQEDDNETENMIVTVSASSVIRRDLQGIVRQYVGRKVELVELDYQLDK